MYEPSVSHSGAPQHQSSRRGLKPAPWLPGLMTFSGPAVLIISPALVQTTDACSGVESSRCPDGRKDSSPPKLAMPTCTMWRKAVGSVRTSKTTLFLSLGCSPRAPTAQNSGNAALSSKQSHFSFSSDGHERSTGLSSQIRRASPQAPQQQPCRALVVNGPDCSGSVISLRNCRRSSGCRTGPVIDRILCRSSSDRGKSSLRGFVRLVRSEGAVRLKLIHSVLVVASTAIPKFLSREARGQSAALLATCAAWTSS
mmetsp:Transcript_126526/g.219358  ORF Transcript_126526/g.219358 Transcript_126526/m.219358 type:complete len:255 (+) Transcript_126526:300-1064(+)